MMKRKQLTGPERETATSNLIVNFCLLLNVKLVLRERVAHRSANNLIFIRMPRHITNSLSLFKSQEKRVFSVKFHVLKWPTLFYDLLNK